MSRLRFRLHSSNSFLSTGWTPLRGKVRKDKVEVRGHGGSSQLQQSRTRRDTKVMPVSKTGTLLKVWVRKEGGRRGNEGRGSVRSRAGGRTPGTVK